MADVRIEVRANGPNRVTGPIEIVDQDGKAFQIPEGQWVSLCRCGASSNKPALPQALDVIDDLSESVNFG